MSEWYGSGIQFLMKLDYADMKTELCCQSPWHRNHELSFSLFQVYETNNKEVCTSTVLKGPFCNFYYTLDSFSENVDFDGAAWFSVHNIHLRVFYTTHLYPAFSVSSAATHMIYRGSVRDYTFCCVPWAHAWSRHSGQWLCSSPAASCWCTLLSTEE